MPRATNEAIRTTFDEYSNAHGGRIDMTDIVQQARDPAHRLHSELYEDVTDQQAMDAHRVGLLYKMARRARLPYIHHDLPTKVPAFLASPDEPGIYEPTRVSRRRPIEQKEDQVRKEFEKGVKHFRRARTMKAILGCSDELWDELMRSLETADGAADGAGEGPSIESPPLGSA